MSKFLVIRFSSIGDIVLTSPVVRSLKQQIPGAEVHFLTKKSFATVVSNNPYIDKIYTIEKSIDEILPALKEEGYLQIIDLHHNLRTLQVKRALKIKSTSFPKLNFKKWMLVNLKINRMPAVHIVDRYFETVKNSGVKNDLQGLDYFISEKEDVAPGCLPSSHKDSYVAFVIGAKHATKMLPQKKIYEIIKEINSPVVLLGGPEDQQRGNEIVKILGSKVFNACGLFKLNESASIIKHAKLVITHDTGLMHIAAAFKKQIISIWGNTVPEFGMYPYLPSLENRSTIVEVKNLSCRPCSKIGFEKCPKKHFKCMNLISVEMISEKVKNILAE